MKSVARKKSVIYLMLLNLVIFTIVTTVLLNKDLYLKCNITSKVQLNHGDSQANLLDKSNESFALKLTAVAPSPTEEETLSHRTYLTSRTPCTHRVFLLIMVLSGPANFDRRTVIRKTWASDPSMKTRWKTVFLLGHAVGDSIQNEYLKAEEIMYRDVIRGSQNEHYRNLTLKTQMGLEWASKYCDFEFLLKADDDVFVNPYKLLDYLAKPDTPKTNLYTGRCPQGGFPHRKGKYAVSWEEYNKNRFPPFCAGPAYLLSSDLAYKLVELFDINTKPLPLEDVYIGTLMQEIGGVKAVTHPWFRLLSYGRCTYSSDTFAQHRATVQCEEQLFNLAMKERVEYELIQIRSVKTARHNSTMNITST